MSETVLLRGAREICQVIRRDRRDIGWLVKNEKLPAWQEQGQGPWFARIEDLEAWAAQRAQKFLNNSIEFNATIKNKFL
jgi:hypothetical protein